ncbi:MAG: AmmeMemoRadiSam system protein A [Candidatus Rokubacteria bacterium]|nr:AmmeMemoRadiSam system protein A [Candidatus Rokubacteria bacterium]
MDTNVLGLARQAVEHYVHTHTLLPQPDSLPAELSSPLPVFVSLRVGDTLRGCIGTLMATKPTLAEEIIANAVAAAVNDPRFPPVSAAELPTLSYEVDIVDPLERVPGEEELDPARYGVVVERDNRRGVLLPAIEGITSTKQQVAIARIKADIAPEEPVTLYRFSVRRFREGA